MSSIVESVWKHTFQNIIMSGKDYKVSTVETKLRNNLKAVSDVKVRFDKDSIEKILAFISTLGLRRTSQIAHALGKLFLYFPIIRVVVPRGKQVFVTVTIPTHTNFKWYERYPSVKKALEVYGIEGGCGKRFDKDGVIRYDGLSASQVYRQLKKERLGERYYNELVKDDIYVKFSVMDPRQRRPLR